MTEESPGKISRLLKNWRRGKKGALDELIPLVHDELRRIATAQMGSERAGHTLQPTALIHEAYLRLVDVKVSWQDRAHFLALASRMMRRILVDHARGSRRQKRGGGWLRVSLDDDLLSNQAAFLDILALDEALERLKAIDPGLSRLIELKHFGGLAVEEIAETLGRTPKQVYKDLAFARAWLHRDLRSEAPNDR